MKRIISIVMVITIVLGLSVTAPVYAETIPDVTKYTYKITPLLSPFADYLYVETNNPDPSSFRLVDESSEFFSEDCYTEISIPAYEEGQWWSVCLPSGTYYNSLLRYKDVVYENETTGRVAGGYIFMTNGSAYSDGGQFTLLQKTSSGDTVLHDEFEKTSVKISCPKLETYLSYLVNSFNIDGMSFFEKVDAVQEYLRNFAVYPRRIIDMDRPNKGYSYPLLISSVYAELPLDLRFYMYKNSDAGLLASKAYPYILDSLGFPGTVAAFAKEIEPECEVEQGYYHYQAEISFAGETRIYGGSGGGGNDPLRSNRVGNTFTFKNGSGLNSSSTLEDYRDKLLSYREIAEADLAEWYDEVEASPYYDRVRESGGTWVRIRTEPGYNYGTTFTYVIPTREGTANAYDAWVDGCYVNDWKRIQTDVSFEDYPTAGIVKHNVTFPDAEGNIYTQDVYYRYNEENDNWTAKHFALDFGYYEEQTLPPQLIITKEEAKSIVKNAGRPRLPNKGLIFDGTAIPGTRFTLTNVTGITLPSNTMKMYIDDDIDLDATVFPSNAFDGGAYWTSSDESVVECYGGIGVGVASARLVAKKRGTVVITAKTYDGAYIATCRVMVRAKGEAFNLFEPLVTGSNDVASGKPKLTWDKVDGATKYDVYRYDKVKKQYVKMYSTTDTTYTNTIATVGETYHYKVKALGPVAAATSAFSKPVTLTYKYAAPVVKGTHDPVTGRNILNWEKVDGATKYDVYRYDKAKKAYVRIYTTAGTTCTNTIATPGETYHYKVKALGPVAAATSAFSKPVTLTYKYAAPVVKGTHDPVTGRNVLNWEKVDGATKYDVYRYDKAKKAYVRIYTTADTTCTNTIATLGETYHYKVKALGTVTAATSAFSKPVTLTYKYAAPVVKGSNGPVTGRNVLNWEKVAGATKYDVYRYDKIKKVYVKMYTTTGTTYTNTIANTGETYHYKVKALGTVTAATSAFSKPVTLTYKYAAPVVKGSNDPVTGRNVLNWEKVAGATKYEIYRYDSVKKEYVKYHTVTSTEFINYSTQVGSVYYYKVKAVGTAAEAASGLSNSVRLVCKCATPKVTGSNDAATGKPKLTWSKVDGATKYEIYKYDSAKKEYVKYYTTTSTSFTNSSAQAGSVNYYKVKAIGATTASDSAMSSPVRIVGR